MGQTSVIPPSPQQNAPLRNELPWPRYRNILSFLCEVTRMVRVGRMPIGEKHKGVGREFAKRNIQETAQTNLLCIFKANTLH